MTRHYQHPGHAITHDGVKTATVYGSTTPILRAEGLRDNLDAMARKHNLKRVYPLGWRTF